MSRRAALVFLATGAAAAALGAGTHWWRTEPTRIDGASAALFAASFPDAQGRPQSLSQWRGQLLVVNFWATWCPPCVDEMPDLQKVRDAYRNRGVEVIGIGIDHAAKVAAFRDRFNLSLPLLVAAAGGSDLYRALGNTGGALPYTVLIGRDGGIRERHMGRIQPDQLRRWIDSALAAA
jgi:peroxiredoxin